MKKFNLLVALSALILGGLSFTACEDTVNNPPAITYDDASPIVLGAGVTSVAVTGQIVADAGLDKVVLFKVVGGSETQIGAAYESFSSGDITTTDDVNYNFRFTLTDITANMTLKITATDKDDQTSSESIVIQTSAAAGGIKSWTATLGGGSSATGSFYASATGDVYTSGVAKDHAAAIDIIFYYGTEAGLSGAGLYAPNSGIKSVYSAGGGLIQTTFSVLNSTKFATTTLTATQFDGATDDALITANVSSPTADAIQVANGSVYGFTTVGGKKGLIKVVSVPASNSGTCSIAVKVQE
ncbi:MAG: hypothetical protein U0T82_03845 [Bacteroidales bacterium]